MNDVPVVDGVFISGDVRRFRAHLALLEEQTSVGGWWRIWWLVQRKRQYGLRLELLVAGFVRVRAQFGKRSFAVGVR